MSKRLFIVFMVGFAVLFLAEVAAVHRFFGSQIFSAADFHSRWYGAKALLMDGQDPYSPEVTAEIEAIRDPEGNRNNSFSFAFPLHVIFTFGPLAFMSYDWAQSFWMVIIQWVIFGTLFLLMSMVGWKPTPLGIGGALLGSLLFYPAARTIILGQFTLHVTLFLVLSLFFLKRGQDRWAGFWLAATSIKPQMVLLVGVWMVLWALFKRRIRFLQGLIIGGVGLLLASMIFLPRWPISFLEDIQRYAEVASGRNPLDVLGEFIVPGNPEVVGILTAVLLGAATLAVWFWGIGGLSLFKRGEGQTNESVGEPSAGEFSLSLGPDEKFDWVLFWTISVSLLILFQTGSTNQVLLFIPLFIWFWQVLKTWGKGLAVIVAGMIIIGPWLLFLATISGDYENPLLLLPLPFLCLLILSVKGRRLVSRMDKAG